MITITEQHHDNTSGLWQRLTYRGPSIDDLYEHYAREHRTDPTAPITGRCEVTIDAPVRRVWDVLSDLRRWPEVNPQIGDVRLEGNVAEGARFTWRNGKAKMASRFAVVEPCRELSWTGTTFGAKAVHRHVLEPTATGGTRLVTEESMTGTLLVLLFSEAKLHASLERWLGAIATASEATGS